MSRLNQSMTPAELRERLESREAIARVREEVAAKRAARLATARTARIKRRAQLTGLEARTRYDVYQSGEARAQRVARTRALALGLLIPVLVAFGVWSAAGVQAGMVKLLGLEEGSAASLAAWLVEPALLGIVAGIIIIRAQLQGAGGDLPEAAARVEFGALAASILLNFAGHWPDSLSGAAFAALAGHALGPIGAAGTAYLISLVQDGVTKANPWTLDDGSEAPSLVDSQETPESLPDAPALGVVLLALRSLVGDTRDAPKVDRARLPERAQQIPAGARVLPVVACSRQRRTSPPEQRSRVAQKPRPDKGKKVPPAARKTAEKPSPRRLTDAQLADSLAELIDSRTLPGLPAVAHVQEALSIGFERAKRVLALHHERTEAIHPGQLSVVDAVDSQETPESAHAAA